MRHRQLVPSLHSARLNPYIDFAASPFTVQQELQPWEPGPHPRRAGISSFGAGGANAHLVVEEYQAPPEPEAPAEPRLLDHRGAEFLLIAAHDDVEVEAPHVDEAHAHSFTQLRMARTRHPVEPLFTGEWA